ncbi:hypothetical protein KPH14_009537 [Odynerus spinipes]|uniref:Uncharacterized protein n=1 Tax=Odynerus spinipes TaxID=1348599 RepID=A0AAD9VRL8_9HYME|nr:hypothetical protein KPH14_009537 [Odynerus spinipes]
MTLEGILIKDKPISTTGQMLGKGEKDKRPTIDDSETSVFCRICRILLKHETEEARTFYGKKAKEVKETYK